MSTVTMLTEFEFISLETKLILNNQEIASFLSQATKFSIMNFRVVPTLCCEELTPENY